MSDESDNFVVSDDEIDDSKHDRLVQDVLNLNKVQNVKKPSRTEPTSKISEYNLVKSVTGDKGTVKLDELTKVLKGRKKHEDISQKIIATTKSKTLPKPLEKPQAERIRRSINYEKVRLELDRWEAFVASNRAAVQQVFPLHSEEKSKIKEKEAEKFPSTFRLKSDLQKKLESLSANTEEFHIDLEEKKEFPMTLKELKERRKEAAKLRAHQSFKEARARRQNKIKSKKYHRILRRERIKQQLKEFEELQKTNPEEALKKLEDIEKARAEERFSLRHKSTGQWARNKLIRAKYDKESRQVLAQQLAISRELTKKVNVDSDSDEEDETKGANTGITSAITDHSNPWVNGVKPSKEVADFVSGYRKFWSDQNMQQNKNMDSDNSDSPQPTTKKKRESIDQTGINNNSLKATAEINKTIKKQKQRKQRKGPSIKVDNDSSDNIDKEMANLESTKSKRTNSFENGKLLVEPKKKKTIAKSSSRDGVGYKANSDTEQKNTRVKAKTKKPKRKKLVLGTSDWDVEDAFEMLETTIKKKLEKKVKKVRVSPMNKRKLGVHSKKKKKDKIDLSIPTRSKKHIIDEEMVEVPQRVEERNREEPPLEQALDQLKQIIDADPVHKLDTDVNINPDKFLKVKKTNLDTAHPNLMTTDDNEEVANQRDLIMEAFEDDDVAADFEKDKKNEIENDMPNNIDLNLPGWGSWAGTNIDSSKRKRRRFILKMPKNLPRRDDNKGSLIINEKAEEKIRSHLVSEVPFPFKSVKDYEASIRAPIGNDWVPETAFRRFIEPSVITKMGSIIEPVTKGMLMGK